MEKESSPEDKNSIVLKGDEYMVVLTANYATWKQEVSWGYGNVYVRDAIYGQLNGSGIIITSDGQEFTLDLRADSRDDGWQTIRSLSDVFEANPLDVKAYADFLGKRILNEISNFTAKHAERSYQDRTFVTKLKGKKATIDLGRFQEFHRNELVAAGLIPQADGQIRIPDPI